MTEPSLKPDECQPCPYCLPGMRTGLPGNACENCMNTGLKYPAAVTGPPDDYPGQLKRAAVELFSDDESAGLGTQAMTRERETLEDFLGELDYAAEVDMALTFDGPSSKRAAETIRTEMERLRETLGHESSYRQNAVAEATRLRAEVEWLRGIYWKGEEENDELRAEVERLRAALTEIISLKPEDMPHAVENSQAAAIARAALEPKP